jgi:hypothetical protein
MIHWKLITQVVYLAKITPYGGIHMLGILLLLIDIYDLVAYQGIELSDLLILECY